VQGQQSERSQKQSVDEKISCKTKYSIQQYWLVYDIYFQVKENGASEKNKPGETSIFVQGRRWFPQTLVTMAYFQTVQQNT